MSGGAKDISELYDKKEIKKLFLHMSGSGGSSFGLGCQETIT